MSYTVAILNSPVFSPSRVCSSHFCKSSLSSSLDKNLSLTLTHWPSSSSLFRLRLQKPPSRLNRASNDCAVSTSSSSSSPSVLLKRKRPARLDILNSGMGFGGGCMVTPVVGMERREVMEAESDGYLVFGKRERREAMKDGHSALLNLQGVPKQ
ncbi:probable protein phosphatase 2C 25 [Camellia sinensis]|uniref:probable protein phosphatase 2C 25 n=1 Tax=Camellia sinensis TaxID=4442 RepID=UPI001036E945|nr:probable protein phosphatase 2C 25 [Camellia sinensis]